MYSNILKAVSKGEKDKKAVVIINCSMANVNSLMNMISSESQLWDLSAGCKVCSDNYPQKLISGGNLQELDNKNNPVRVFKFKNNPLGKEDTEVRLQFKTWVNENLALPSHTALQTTSVSRQLFNYATPILIIAALAYLAINYMNTLGENNMGYQR